VTRRIGPGREFTGIIELVKKEAFKFEGEHGENISAIDIPEDMKEKVSEYYAVLQEKVAEANDDLTDYFLENGALTDEMLKNGLRNATINSKLYPVFCGSSLQNVGVQFVLNGVVAYLPSPLDVKEIKGHHPETNAEVVRHPSDDEPLAAIAFKIATDPFVGRLTFVRVYSGVLKGASAVYNPRSNNNERIGRLVRLHANSREEITEIRAGDIGAVIGLKDTRTGDTLCDEKAPIQLEAISFAEPVISIAIEPKTKADQEKMGIALQKLAEEDPTFRVRSDEETAQTIIAGMGELHLDILVDRMRREFKVEKNVGTPQGAYRETITKERGGEPK